MDWERLHINMCNGAQSLLVCLQGITISIDSTSVNRHQLFLNQARAWFLKIIPVLMSVCVHACVCVSTPEAINN